MLTAYEPDMTMESKKYHVFLSYNTRHRLAVEELAHGWSARDSPPFLTGGS